MNAAALSDTDLIRTYVATTDRLEIRALLMEYHRRGWLTRNGQTTAKYRKAVYALQEDEAKRTAAGLLRVVEKSDA